MYTGVLKLVYTHFKPLHVSAIHVAIFRDVKYRRLDILEARNEIIKISEPIQRCKIIII